MFRPSALDLKTTRRERKSPQVNRREGTNVKRPLFFFTCFLSLTSCSCCCSSGLGVTKKQVAVKSTRGIALKTSHGLMVKTGAPGGGGGGGQGGKAGQQGQTGGGGDNTPKNTRQFFDGEESCYIIDAKLEGNLGRYLNVRIYFSRTIRFHLNYHTTCSSHTLSSLSLLCITAQL